MAPTTSIPARRHRRPDAAALARLVVMLAGGLVVWSWSAGPAVARQVTPGGHPAQVMRRAAQVSAAVREPRPVRLAGNAGNVE